MKTISRFFLILVLLLTFSSISSAEETLADVKAQFEAARAKVRDLTMKGAPESELTKQKKLVEDLREKMRIKQSESFSGFGN